MKLVLLALLALTGCSSSPESIGDTLWTRPEVSGIGRVGNGGQIVVAIDESMRFIDANGRFGWEAPFSSSVFQIDDAGNVYVLRPDGDKIVLERLAAADGAVEWSKTLTLDAGSHSLAIDAQGSLWWFLSAEAPVDVGGGALATPIGGLVYGRFGPTDGAYLAGGTLDFSFGEPRRAPDGGFIVKTTRDGELVSFDTAADIRWRSSSGVIDFVVHANGEVTANQPARNEEQVFWDVVRLDARGSERWRKPSVGLAETMVPLPSGGALLAGYSDVGDDDTLVASFLAHYDAQGNLRREDFEGELVTLFRGSAPDGYRMFRSSSTPTSMQRIGEIEARSAP